MTNETTPPLGNAPRVELAQTEDLETTEETVYTTGISGGIDEENLIQVNVNVSGTQTAAGSAITNPASSGQAALGRGGVWSRLRGPRALSEEISRALSDHYSGTRFRGLGPLVKGP